MRDPNVDPAKLRQLAQRLTLREFGWLCDTVLFGLTTPHDLFAFIASSLEKRYDSELRRRVVANTVSQMTADEVVWFCDYFKRPTQTTRRRRRQRSARRRASGERVPG